MPEWGFHHLSFGPKSATLAPQMRAAQIADVVKLVDTPDLGSGAARRGGSSPSIRTMTVRSQSNTVSLAVYFRRIHFLR